jgi:hypothetical protein
LAKILIISLDLRNIRCLRKMLLVKLLEFLLPKIFGWVETVCLLLKFRQESCMVGDRIDMGR